jgi:hypothetical protein
MDERASERATLERRAAKLTSDPELRARVERSREQLRRGEVIGLAELESRLAREAEGSGDSELIDRTRRA